MKERGREENEVRGKGLEEEGSSVTREEGKKKERL